MNTTKPQTACFTGHRNIPQWQREEIYEKTKAEIEKLIHAGYLYFGAGGAIGYDMIAERAVLELREKYPQIKLILVLPCPSQADRWNEADKAEYKRLFAAADKRKFTSTEYTRDCMFKRNRRLVDCSSVCISFLQKPNGGTAYTVGYAEKNGVKVINVA